MQYWKTRGNYSWFQENAEDFHLRAIKTDNDGIFFFSKGMRMNKRETRRLKIFLACELYFVIYGDCSYILREALFHSINSSFQH